MAQHRFFVTSDLKAAACAALLALLSALTLFPAAAAGDGAVCARVKIEIRQELALERQAFDAHMRIHNALEHIRLENVAVEIFFSDENGCPVAATSEPADSAARFFIRLDTLDGITDVAGAGSVAPSADADIHWLIVPAPGAANGRAAGARYFVGARLTYRIGGEAQVTEVAPDQIVVKPLPEIALDYFLPAEVFGDDPFTPAVEPATVFPLGVRVKNNGFGIARALKIDSAQPRIVENAQGLLVGFVIEGSEVDGQPAGPSLLADFGDIAPGSAKMGRWWMSCSLSGRFVAFDAAFSHADELGGELTSLVAGVETHTLVRDVRVDLPGRDAVVDFLARDGDVHRVYESEGADSLVHDHTAAAALQPDGGRYRLTAPVTAGFMHVCLPDPHAGRMLLRAVTRADGKRIKPENAWLSKFQDPDTHGWHHFVNLFDANTPGTYTIAFENPANLPRPPVLQLIPDRARVEGQQLGFIVEASDPDGTVPRLTAGPLPAGAVFSDDGEGSGTFSWTPAVGQAGRYPITFTASDGALSASRQAVLTVFAVDDSDGDGLTDSWELEHFGTLERDGSGDADGDGWSDLEEFLNGTDPNQKNHGPSAPVITTPSANETVAVLAPTLTVANSTDPDGDPLTYHFEVFADPGFKHLVAAAPAVAEGPETTAWTVAADLGDNRRYHWRVRAGDGALFSPWAHGRFFVSTRNDPPGAFAASHPANGTAVDSLSPLLSVSRAVDPDGDPLVYTFEVYADSAMAVLAASGSGVQDEGAGTVSWVVEGAPLLRPGARYFWRALATDPAGAASSSPLASFWVETANSAPGAPFILSPPPGGEVPGPDLEMAVSNALDGDGDPLTYQFELDRVDTFDSDQRVKSGPVPEGQETTAWAVAGLAENSRYFWRVKAVDPSAESPWVTGSFRVNGVNDPPPIPVVKNPGDGAWVDSLTPRLVVHPLTDPDGDGLSYRFLVYADQELTEPMAESGPVAAEWAVPTALADNTRYFWTVQAVDAHGAAGEWSAVSGFLVSHTPSEDLVVTVVSDADRPFDGVRVYTFTDAGGYTGRHAATAADGTAVFAQADFTPGSYRLRVDYRGHTFWSDPFSLPQTGRVQVVILEETVTVTVAAPAGLAAGARVYLFSETGAFLGASAETDQDGRARFQLPAGAVFKFRADLQGHRYWSAPITVAGGAANTIGVDAGGGRLRITLGEGPETPMAGVPVYLFSAAGAYLGEHRTTDLDGGAEFSAAAGRFKLRADYLGYQFWSDEVAVAADTAVTLTIPHQEVAIGVCAAFAGTLAPLPEVPVHLFTPSGTYLNLTLRTGPGGRALIHLPERAYRVRADYLNQQFWSEAFTWQESLVTVPMADAEIQVTWNGFPLEGVPVYVFTETGRYQELSGSTDAGGNLAFRLPAGVYTFRADYQSSQYWSAPTVLAADQITPVEITTGGGTFTLTLAKDSGEPLAGVSCYVFSGADAYLNLSGVTDSDGAVAFDLADGDYRVRIDYLGHRFWTEVLRVPETFQHAAVIPHHDLTVRVAGDFAGDLQPRAGVPVHLFDAAGAYLSVSERTDENGAVFFSLPEKPYQVRVDTLGQQFWSDVFQGQDVAVTIPEAVARVRVAGAQQAICGVPVYVFSTADSYLNLRQDTGPEGIAIFRLPAGGYRFRADYQGSRYWASAGLAAHSRHDVALDTGGGAFTLSVDTGSGPLADTRVYVFTAGGTYLGLYGVTNGDGQAVFHLAGGSYTFRVDHLGYPFWSPAYRVPDELSGVFAIPHQEVTITVAGDFPAAEPCANLKVHLFTPAGAFLNQSWTTDQNGRLGFNLPDRAYTVRVDYLGQRFWSDPFRSQDATVTIPHGALGVEVSRLGAVLAGARVHLFSEEAAYLGAFQETDAFGMAHFVLPAGTFKFRIDQNGERHWSQPIGVLPGTETRVPVELME